jgi:hypothetical protein
MRRWLRVGAAIVMVALVVAGLPPQVAQAQVGVPPDIVRMKNGGLLRGTIIELAPGETVTVMTVDGQTRQIPMAEVSYAGPAGNESPPQPAAVSPQASPPPSLQAPSSQLQLRASEPGITFHVKRGMTQGFGSGWISGRHGGHALIAVNLTNYELLCTAPCTTSLPPGSYELGLSQGAGRVVAANTVTLVGNEALHGEYVSNQRLRIGTLAVSVALVVGGTFLLLARQETCGAPFVIGSSQFENCTTEYPYFVPGLVIGGIGGLLPLSLFAMPDRAIVTPQR